MRSFRIVDREGKVKVEVISHDVVVVDILADLAKNLPHCYVQEKKHDRIGDYWFRLSE